VFRHIVLFRVRDGVEDDRLASALGELRSLGALPGVASWQIERSLDTRKGRVIVEDATFIDRRSFEQFRDHPRHVAVALVMSEIADWWNGDYEA
jgi:hypothetical protein